MEQRVSVGGLLVVFILLVVSCAAREKRNTGPSATGIEGPKWQLVEVGGAPVSPLPGERQPFITFNEAKTQATGFAGCNNFFGSYELDGPSLTFGPVGATRMFCEGLSGDIEIRFMQALEQTRSWELMDGALLFLKNKEVLARFTIGN